MVRTSKPLLTLCAADVMSAHVVMIPREMSLQGAARMLARSAVTGAPVVDDVGRCIGVLSATDFMHWVEDPKTTHMEWSGEPSCSDWDIPAVDLAPGCLVEDFMTRDPVLVFPSTKIGVLARMMMDAHIHRLIVVDPASRRPVGIVSSMDVLAAVARADLADTSSAGMIHEGHSLQGAHEAKIPSNVTANF